MRIAVRINDHVAGGQLQRRLALDAYPTIAAGDDVITNEMLGAGKHRAHNRLARWRFRYPRLRRLNVEEDGAGKANRLQHIRQRIHLLLHGRSSMNAGRTIIRVPAIDRYTLCHLSMERFYSD